MAIASKPTERLPRQERGHKRRERILSAAERLLRTSRFEDLTVAEIVREAHSSVGSFYHLFESKDALIGPLYSRYDRRITERVGPILDPRRWRGRSLEYRVGRLIRYGVRLYRNEGGLMRALVLHARSHAAHVSRLQRRHRASFYDQLTELLLERRAEITHPRPEGAIRLALFFVGATCRDKILFGDAPHPRSIALDDRSLAHELTRAFLSYVQSHQSGGSSDEAV